MGLSLTRNIADALRDNELVCTLPETCCCQNCPWDGSHADKPLDRRINEQRDDHGSGESIDNEFRDRPALPGSKVFGLRASARNRIRKEDGV